jgi:hypothetical protein
MKKGGITEKDLNKILEEVWDECDSLPIEMDVSHAYLTGFSGKTKIHHCLQVDYWCWRQAIREPGQAIKYLIRKVWRK